MKAVTMLFLILTSFSLHARSEFVILASNSIPPYIYEEKGLVRGIQFEMLTHIFKAMNKSFKVKLAPNKRIESLFLNSKRSVLLNIPIRPDRSVPVFYSDTLINFKNCAIINKNSPLKVKSIGDLQKYKVGGFQAASRYLGPEFQKMTMSNPDYREYSNQEAQAFHLLNDRIDVIVSDFNVFKHYARKHFYTKFKRLAPFCALPISKTPRVLTFKAESERDEFNKAMLEFKKTDDFKELISRYELEDN